MPPNPRPPYGPGASTRRSNSRLHSSLAASSSARHRGHATACLSEDGSDAGIQRFLATGDVHAQQSRRRPRLVHKGHQNTAPCRDQKVARGLVLREQRFLPPDQRLVTGQHEIPADRRRVPIFPDSCRSDRSLKTGRYGCHKPDIGNPGHHRSHPDTSYVRWRFETRKRRNPSPAVSDGPARGASAARSPGNASSADGERSRDRDSRRRSADPFPRARRTRPPCRARRKLSSPPPNPRAPFRSNPRLRTSVLHHTDTFFSPGHTIPAAGGGGSSATATLLPKGLMPGNRTP